MSERRLVPVDDGHLVVDITGAGAPVVVLQTALDAEELTPLCRALAGRDGIEVLHLRRRGYAGSSPAGPRPSVAADAADVATALRALDRVPAHVVGVSYSAAVALTLAAGHPEVVDSLVLVEPPPTGIPAAREFRSANRRLLAVGEARGPAAAADELMTMLDGDDWRAVGERDRPGSVAGIEAGAATFLHADVPALLGWELGVAEMSRIRCRVLHVAGSRTSAWFTEMGDHLHALLPQASRATVRDAGHLVASTHPAQLGALVAAHATASP